MDDLVFIFNPGSEENIARVHNLIYDSDSDGDMSGDEDEDCRFEEIIEKRSKKSDKKS